MTAPELTSVFQPFAWQVAPWRDQSPIMLLTGSKNGGKSHIAAEKIHGFLLRYPGATALLLRKAHEFAVKSIVPMMQYVIGDDHRVRFVNGIFMYANGSRAYVAGMKNKEQREAARSVRGEKGEPDIAWMEEATAFTRDDFEELDANVRGHVAGWNQIILSTNPDIPQHWIYIDLILGGQARVYYSSIDDNPRATQLDRDRLSRLTGVLRDRLKEGKWVRAEGVVYDEFNPQIHMLDELPVRLEDCTIYRVVDFGYTNPFVCQWWAVDGDGRMYLFREIHERQKLVEDLTPCILKLSGGMRIAGTVADHDAEDRATMERHGVKTIAASKEVIRGIQVVKGRLAVQGDGKPRMYIIRGSLVNLDGTPRDDTRGDEEDGSPISTATEMNAYSWAKLQDGKANKEEPVKMFDHHMDTTRYMSVHLDGYVRLPDAQPAQRSKWLKGEDQVQPEDEEEKERVKPWTRTY